MIKFLLLVVGGIVASAIAILLIPTFVVLIASAMLVFVILFLVLWACGIPLTITRPGHPVQKLRWFTLYHG